MFQILVLALLQPGFGCGRVLLCKGTQWLVSMETDPKMGSKETRLRQQKRFSHVTNRMLINGTKPGGCWVFSPKKHRMRRCYTQPIWVILPISPEIFIGLYIEYFKSTDSSVYHWKKRYRLFMTITTIFYIHPSICTRLSYSGLQDSRTYPRRYGHDGGNNPGWGASPPQQFFIIIYSDPFSIYLSICFIQKDLCILHLVQQDDTKRCLFWRSS